ncbi:response regulator [Cupriavidus taiwanensis]|uniref:response regulator n=1 Tax=Cupriavidus taiwanensis TaxID=164546 RepID=UPI000E10B3C7|nr:response regulator [Cupriavidus taiwanensis]SOY69287.1 putative multi-site Sensor histidine kinase [Cupriavidus taiwanensis]SOY69973.1 putative multi-site Sensor histidine kinase [Cupriavidus taiwanensis]SOY92325.1 putative multi-site Sensor histidine kinase [Cupriavidus taiwanensis]SPA18106.1 putative multi-site Sensor histidine kinase [Cupriavidus taiwanensis]SPD56027.1 PAS domain S-box-containing protein [Cupriavidus taiwanensis]
MSTPAASMTPLPSPPAPAESATAGASEAPVPLADKPGFLAGGGEMGALMRGFDWGATPLGQPQGWPHSLKTAIRIMLTSRQPIWIGWGEALHFFYNDAYKAIIGGKHPAALGQPTSAVWREIWPEIAPLLATAMTGSEGTFVEQKLLIMERNGYPEETYYTFSYSPVPDDHGGTGGIICANSDDTERVLAERQLNVLRDVAATASDARAWRDACARAMAALSADPRDIVFALLYVAEPGARMLQRAGAIGIADGHPGAPAQIALEAHWPWPVAEVVAQQQPVLLDGLAGRFAVPLPGGAWGVPPSRAAVIEVAPSGSASHRGVLVVGLNPFRLFDERYRAFLTLAAGQIGAAMHSALAYEAERKRAEALAEIDRAKTAFFSNISHEFRTPLTLMLGPLEELVRRAGPGEDRAMLEMTHRNGLRLLKLVNALLDFSRIESGRVTMRRQPTDVAALTADLASLFRASIEAAGITLQVDCPPLCPPLARAVAVDRDMWETIVLNLVSNAFKFTFAGTITVAVAPHGDDAVALTVRDTGIGIPTAELPRIFERFHRVEGAQGRTIEGSGIGLALVQELVRLHGGTIEVQSVPGEGTCFTVSLPARVAAAMDAAMDPVTDAATQADAAPPASSVQARAYVETALRWPRAEMPPPATPLATEEPPLAFAQATAQASAEAGDAGHAGALVLVVDDNDDLRDYMRRLLGAAGHRVAVAADGEAALALARAHAPALVVSDVMMPRLDGFGLVRALRADAALSDTPVLLLSARAGEEARVSGLGSGADDYLVKPFSARELLARVASNLRLSALRRATERRLQELNASLERRVTQAVADHDRLWELSEDLLIVARFDGCLQRVSPAWARTLGHAPQQVLGRAYLSFIYPDDVAGAGAQLDALRHDGVPVRFECRQQRADGALRWLAWTLSVDPANGHIHGVGRDVTGDREAQAALRHADEALRTAQKMEAIGNLTGGVAHDFNNLLQVIGGNLQLLTRDLASDDRAGPRLRSALAGVARGAKLASQLLAFGRRQPLAPRVVNLGRLVRTLDDMLRRALGDGIEVETVVSPDLWNTLVDPFQVENALLNLAINARDAMHGHGRLTLAARNARPGEATGEAAPAAPMQYVLLSVTDTGVGMPPEVQERAFEPFFTTKPEGQGTGLGLSMVYGFIRQSDGHVKIASEPGRGTTVTLFLPRVLQDEDPDIELDAGPVRGGSETVLVVEDDDDVRATVVEMLASLGYQVLRARDAHSALAIAERGVPVDLLFSDVVMPGPLRSTELARKLRERLPDVGVLFTSGYADSVIVHDGRLDAGIELLSKPYTHEALARKVRHVLANRGQRAAMAAMGAAVAGAATARQVSPAPLRVLCVDDDALVRAGTAEVLRAYGMHALEADSESAALAMLAGNTVDVLVTDVALAGDSGVDLALAASARQPGLGVVFATGYVLELTPAQRAALGAVAVLRKPYPPQMLLDVLRDVVSDGVGAAGEPAPAHASGRPQPAS